ncbi:M48 family metallopeptidase [Alkalihalobacillus sp. BA299]|uniref:M48 family metallopeptidase n=1 Tax=Alkalihalobacillus sp. BA299 TaxID=2815938 RepID=UPI001ADA05AD|nr:M48 family metallopeptidase [Alkalihalobacillus sp. BA299]
MNPRLIHDNEKSYYILCLLISISTYLALIISIIGIVYILIGVLITFFLHGISIGHIRNNGVRLTEKQFPEIYKRAREIGLDMELTDFPEIYIVQSDGILNAFATRFFGRNFVVLYSDIVEIVEEGNTNELDFVIAHELAHLKRKHISKNILILPALWVPFLGNAYSRACEYTCDRVATAYTKDSQASINALAILAVGKRLAKDVHIEEYLNTASKETGFFLWLSHVLSSHPPLPLRIKEIYKLQSFPEMYGLSRVG